MLLVFSFFSFDLLVFFVICFGKMFVLVELEFGGLFGDELVDDVIDFDLENFNISFDLFFILKEFIFEI